MEIKFKVDTPAAKIEFALSCNEAETQMMINDPVYQNLGAVLVDQLKWESEQCRNHDHKINHHNDRFDHMRKVYEADRKCQQEHNRTVVNTLRIMQDQLNRIIDSHL